MKVQDIGFFSILLVLFAIRRPRWLLFTGLTCWAAAIPLFSRWVFFTAERLTWYGALLVFLYMLSLLLRRDTVE